MIVDLRDYARILRKRWALVLLCTLLSLGAAAAATLVSRPMYTSTAQIIVLTPRDSGDNAGSAYQGSLAAQLQVKTYAKVAVSPTVTDKVAKGLGLDPQTVSG